MEPHAQDNKNAAKAYLCVSQDIGKDDAAQLIPYEEITILSIDDEGISYDNGGHANGAFSGADYTVEVTPGHHSIACKVRYVREEEERWSRVTVHTVNYEFRQYFKAGQKYLLSINKMWRKDMEIGPFLQVKNQTD